MPGLLVQLSAVGLGMSIGAWLVSETVCSWSGNEGRCLVCE